MTRLKDVGDGLKLALRGRVQLRQDLVDFENPRETIRKVDELSEDLVRNGLIDLGNEISYGWDRERDREGGAGDDQRWPRAGGRVSSRIPPCCRERLQEIENMGREKFRLDRVVAGRRGRASEAGAEPGVQEEYLDVGGRVHPEPLHGQEVDIRAEAEDVYIPQEISWAQKGTWK